MQNEVITVQCPHCGRDVIWDELSPWRPFCS
ncbi:MAG: DNA gyrase inhibitor YacG, partial [Pantoea sp.]|nr:DNA gyrase inhibitor YacG [Pantoea sp.]